LTQRPLTGMQKLGELLLRANAVVIRRRRSMLPCHTSFVVHQSPSVPCELLCVIALPIPFVLSHQANPQLQQPMKTLL
jgi:hypothetical protein